ncbi:hypothetical protein FB451DRAFT_1167056 [Mycena latifolia]|nr:hypothetical protein FB451DRAFT_1167056 [Mycena latifolia]
MEVVDPSPSPPTITISQAQAVVDKEFTDPSATIVNFTRVAHGFSYTPRMSTYLLDLALGSSAEATHSSFLVVSTEAEDALEEGTWHPNALELFPALIGAIRTNTSIPVHAPTLDTSRVLMPYAWLLTPAHAVTSARLMSLAQARTALTAHQRAMVDVQLGTYLGELHARAQNDWFGLPSPSTSPTPPSDAAYDWQETFTPLLEDLLSSVPAALPYLPTLRPALARAIASFLFADVDVPSLIWFTGSADDVFLAFSEEGVFSAFAILPAVGHALWGDPLMEAFFVGAGSSSSSSSGGEGERGPSAAFWEAYRLARSAADPAAGDILAFPRQRTKRLWYDVFLALVVLRERRHLPDDEKIRWAQKTLGRSAEALRDAPCY